MSGEPATGITELLVAWENGDERALNRLIPLVYPELRRIARQYLGRRPQGQSIESAVLANEVYLKLARAGSIRCENRLHFLAICSQMIRRILVDHVRSRSYLKRGGHAVRVSLDEVLLGAEARGIDLLALDEALEALSKLDKRKTQLVDLRYFGGLTLSEAADILVISEKTAKRDWSMAKAWLFNELTRPRAKDVS